MLGSGSEGSSSTDILGQASEAASSFESSLRSVIPGASNGEDAQGACFSELSYETRLQGFTICFIAGFLVSILSTLLLSVANVKGFAILYTTGNIVSILSTGFLVGPKRQCKLMCKSSRIVATLVYFVSLVLTLVLAFSDTKAVFVIPFIVIQWMAGVWYVASYIPFARDAIKGCCRTSLNV